MDSTMVLKIIIGLIIFLYALRGMRKGFIRTLMSMAFLIMAAVLVYFANPTVSSFLKEKTPVYDVLEDKCRDIFSMKNSGDAVDLYGICIGETIQNADVILIKNGWKKAYDSYDGASCVYGTVLNGNAYMLELYKSDEKMESWYLNNWPQGDWGEEFYEQF